MSALTYRWPKDILVSQSSGSLWVSLWFALGQLTSSFWSPHPWVSILLFSLPFHAQLPSESVLPLLFSMLTPPSVYLWPLLTSLLLLSLCVLFLSEGSPCAFSWYPSADSLQICLFSSELFAEFQTPTKHFEMGIFTARLRGNPWSAVWEGVSYFPLQTCSSQRPLCVARTAVHSCSRKVLGGILISALPGTPSSSEILLMLAP